MSGPVEIILIVAAICYVLARRVAGEPAQAKRMLLLPAVLTAIGVSDAGPITRSGATAVAFLVASTAISVVIGVLRGLSVRLRDRDGIVFMNYTAVTVVLWVVNVVVKLGADLLLRAVDPHGAAGFGNSLLLTLGAGMLCEGGVVLLRALNTDSRILWESGKDGRAHTTSTWLDALQSRMAERRR